MLYLIKSNLPIILHYFFKKCKLNSGLLQFLNNFIDVLNKHCKININ